MEGSTMLCLFTLACGILTVNGMPRRNVLMMMIPKNGDGMPKVVAFPRHMIDNMMPRKMREDYQIENAVASMEYQGEEDPRPPGDIPIPQNLPYEPAPAFPVEPELQLEDDQEEFRQTFHQDQDAPNGNGLSNIEAKMSAMESIMDEMQDSMPQNQAGTGGTYPGGHNNDNTTETPIQINYSDGCEAVGMFLPNPNDSCTYYACRYGPEPWRTGNVFNVIVTALPCPHGLAVAEEYKGGYGNPCTKPSQRCSQPKNDTNPGGGYGGYGSGNTVNTGTDTYDSTTPSPVPTTTNTQFVDQPQQPAVDPVDNNGVNMNDIMAVIDMENKIREKMAMIQSMMDDLKKLMMDLSIMQQSTNTPQPPTPSTLAPTDTPATGTPAGPTTTPPAGQTTTPPADQVEHHTYPPEDIPLGTSGKCMMLGQYLPVPGSECYYYRCVYGRDPNGGNVSIQPKMMRCSNTLAVPPTYTGSMYSPCTMMSFGCKIVYEDPGNSTTTYSPGDAEY